ncbi:MAG TPA: hypothetical protein VLC09_19305 [Polyangiaceae bacterium]|nr:hypothetical protein [Polyangiaceae bacterium]
MTEHDLPEQDRPSEPPLPLLARALAQPPKPARSLLPGIQERIRERTHGRYFRRRRVDLRNPTTLLLGVVLLVLVLSAATYLVLSNFWAAR